ncbi:MAG: phage major capsid protein [Patescibacteria group bacterium]|jgi:HK97 family phage prohead protease
MGSEREQNALTRLYDESRPDVILVACDVAFEFSEATDGKEGDIDIEGWFITENLIESRNLIVKASAFTHKEGMSLFNGRVLAFHDQYKEPIGEVTKLEIVKNKGIRGKVRIWRENSSLLMRAIREGKLEAFSIGFVVDKYEVEEKTGTVTVIQGRLKEVSIVNIGADSNALFEVRNSLEDKKAITTNLSERSLNLATKDNTPVTVEQVMSENEKLGVRVDELQGILNGIREAQTQAADRMITKSELAERLEKFSTDLAGIKTMVETVKAERAVADTRFAYTDYRSLITDFVWLTDDDGNKLGEVAQRAYCLFQMPVDYDKMDNGQELKNLRDLHDAMLIADAMNRYKGRDRYTIQNLKLYKQLVKLTEKFDKDVALAMAGGNTGYGAEWLPSELSSEFNEILRVQPRLASKFLTWNMPKGGSAKYPFQNGKAVVYKGGEALVDNAEEHRKTNIATGVKTFTPDLFVGALVASEEVTEDAILDMVAFIRTELAKALLEGLESAMINGDDSATHFDNVDETKYQTYQVETSFKGIRKLGITVTRDIEDSSATTGVNALEIVNFTDAKQDMVEAGLNPSECLYVTGIKGRSQVQQALFKEDALGVLAFMISGTLPTIDGSEIYISGQYLETLASSGLYAPNTDVKHTSMCCVHKPSFRIGQRRGVTLEYNKNILTQQQQFVATARWDFGKICADAIVPVAEMINIQHTA